MKVNQLSCKVCQMLKLVCQSGFYTERNQAGHAMPNLCVKNEMYKIKDLGSFRSDKKILILSTAFLSYDETCIKWWLFHTFSQI